jgi:hypothetical protein
MYDKFAQFWGYAIPILLICELPDVGHAPPIKIIRRNRRFVHLYASVNVRIAAQTNTNVHSAKLQTVESFLIPNELPETQ